MSDLHTFLVHGGPASPTNSRSTYVRTRHLLAAGLSVAALPAASLAPSPAGASSVEQKDPTVHSVDINRATKNNARPRSSPLLSYHGGAISPGGHVFVVYWGSQWGTAG